MRSPAAHRRADSRPLCAKLRGVTPLHPIEASALHARRERVFLVLAGSFLGSMTMLNILGVSRFLDLSFTVFGLRIPMALAVGRGVLGLDEKPQVAGARTPRKCLSAAEGRIRAARVVWIVHGRIGAW